MGLYAEAGSLKARDILIDRVSRDINNQEAYHCAKIAARGLLVIAYENDDTLAMEALAVYRENYEAFWVIE